MNIITTGALWFSLLSITVSVTGCKRDINPPLSTVMPPPLVFILLNSKGDSLITSYSSPIKVYNITSTGQQNVLGPECAGGGCRMVRKGDPPYSYYFQSQYAALGSAQAGQKTWYIELNGKTDTLYFDVRKTNTNDPLMMYQLAACYFNGVRLPSDYPFVLHRKQ